MEHSQENVELGQDADAERGGSAAEGGGTPVPGSSEGAPAPADVLAQAQEELDEKLRAETNVMPTFHIGGYVPGKTRVAADVAELKVDEATSAAGIGEELERDAYEDEKRVESDAALIKSSNAPLAAEAAQILAEEKRDLDDAMGESVKTSVEASEAEHERRHHLGRTGADVAAALVNAEAAESDLGRESADLADADRALAQLEADMRKAGIEPPPAADA